MRVLIPKDIGRNCSSHDKTRESKTGWHILLLPFPWQSSLSLCSLMVEYYFATDQIWVWNKGRRPFLHLHSCSYLTKMRGIWALWVFFFGSLFWWMEYDKGDVIEKRDKKKEREKRKKRKRTKISHLVWYCPVQYTLFHICITNPTLLLRKPVK